MSYISHLIAFICLIALVASPIAGAIILAIKGIDGWGWFLFVGVIFILCANIEFNPDGYSKVDKEPVIEITNSIGEEDID